MTLHTTAIYEGGVLRPLEPLSLAENQIVSVEISTSPPAESDEECATRQRQGLMAFIKFVEANPLPAPDDGLSNRDHDQIIYGNIK